VAELLEQSVEIGQETARLHVAASGSSALRLSLLGRLIAAWTPGDPFPRCNRLIAGLDNVESALPSLAIEALAAEAQRHPDWVHWLCLPTEEALASLKEGAAPGELARRLTAFLGRFGHRAVSEGELRAAAWADDPTPLLGALLGSLGSGRSADFLHRARAEMRGAEEEAILSRLGPLRRGIFRWALRGAQEGVRQREHTKSLAVSLVQYARRLAKRAAQHLVASQVLRQLDDVYFLTLSELVRALHEGDVSLPAVERRRRRFEREGALWAPRDVDLDSPAATSESGPLMKGTPVSAGVGAGPARVLLPGEALSLEPGEVLVTRVLDAAWGPLLTSAAAAVAEVGGVLSHGAVVARELGIPCVVDVAEATQRISTGESVFVDGGSGEVRLLTAGPTQAERPADFLPASDRADEDLHPLEDDPRARESVYFNVQEPGGLCLVFSLGVRKDKGEALLALILPEKGVLFGLDRAAVLPRGASVRVGGAEVFWNPTRLSIRTRLALHEPSSFPPAALPLLLSPRTLPVSVELTFRPTTPAIDLSLCLDGAGRRALRPLGDHHIEQTGVWEGDVIVDGHHTSVSGTGSRDHSWGLRDWDAADYWRLFTVGFGDELALHALSVGIAGGRTDGGFVWRQGRAERITRIEHATAPSSSWNSLELEVLTAAGSTLYLRGTRWRTITVPVQLERRPWLHLLGRPYRLILHENYTRYEISGRSGYGMAEFTERPR